MKRSLRAFRERPQLDALASVLLRLGPVGPIRLPTLLLLALVAVSGLTSCVKRTTTTAGGGPGSTPPPIVPSNPQPGTGSLHGSEADYAMVPPDKQIRWSYASMPNPAPDSRPNYLLRSFNFPSGGTAFDEEARSVLRESAEALKQRPKVQVLVVGFCDNVQEMTNAENLATQRAQAVRTILTGDGVPKERIKVASFGASLAEAKPDQPLAQQQDRRVEIWLMSE